MKLKLFKEFKIFENLEGEPSLEDIRKITKQAFPDIAVHTIDKAVGGKFALYINEDESLLRYKNSYSLFLIRRHDHMYLSPFKITEDMIDSFMELSSYLKHNENIVPYILKINVGVQDGTGTLYKDFEYECENIDMIDKILNKYIDNTFNRIKIYYKCSINDDAIDMAFDYYTKEFDIFESPTVQTKDSKDSKLVMIRKGSSAFRVKPDLIETIKSYIDVMEYNDYELEYIKTLDSTKAYNDIDEFYHQHSHVNSIAIKTREK